MLKTIIKQLNYKELSENICDYYIGKLQEGIIPWCPFDDMPDPADEHCWAYNAYSGEEFMYFNAMKLQHPNDGYLTGKQISELGGRVKKDCHPEDVWKFWYNGFDKVDKDGNPVLDEDGNPVKFFRNYAKAIKEFWIGDCTGLKLPKHHQPKPLHNYSPIEKADAIIKNYLKMNPGLSLTDGKRDVRYDVDSDTICTPNMNQFHSPEEYYASVFKMLSVSSGTKERENRFQFYENYKKQFSKESLLSEIVSAMLMRYCGIDTRDTVDNSAATIASWVKAFNDDEGMVIWAGRKAERVMKYVLNGLVEEAAEGVQAEEQEPVPEFKIEVTPDPVPQPRIPEVLHVIKKIPAPKPHAPEPMPVIDVQAKVVTEKVHEVSEGEIKEVDFD